MRIVLSIVGVLCVLMGGVWVLQGISVLPGSYMTGQMKWAINGAILLCIGLALLAFANRRKR